MGYYIDYLPPLTILALWKADNSLLKPSSLRDREAKVPLKPTHRLALAVLWIARCWTDHVLLCRFRASQKQHASLHHHLKSSMIDIENLRVVIRVKEAFRATAIS